MHSKNGAAAERRCSRCRVRVPRRSTEERDSQLLADADGSGGAYLHLDGLDVAGIYGASGDPGDPDCDGGSTCVATPENASAGACVFTGGDCHPGADQATGTDLFGAVSDEDRGLQENGSWPTAR